MNELSKRYTGKTEEERRRYYSHLSKNSNFTLSGIESAPRLRGSDTAFDDDYALEDTQKVKKVSRYARRKMHPWTWQKKLLSLSIPIIISILGFLFYQIYDIHAEVNVLLYRADALEQRVESIKNDSVTKDYLTLSIDSVKLELHGLLPNVDEINKRLDALEDSIISNENK